MNYLNDLISRHASGKKVLSLFIITNALFIFMLTVTMSNTMDYAGGMKLLDLRFSGYDINDVSQLFGALGESGRWYYLNRQLPVDMVYPLLFGLSYCLLLGFFLNKINRLKTPYSFLCFIPVIAGISDYMENIGILTMLLKFPDLSKVLVITTNTFSMLKSISMIALFIILALAILIYAQQSISAKKHMR